MFIAIPQGESSFLYVNVDNVNEFRLEEDTLVIFFKDESVDTIYFKSPELAELAVEGIVNFAGKVYNIDEDDLNEEFN